jgi:hypothetical protein
MELADVLCDSLRAESSKSLGKSGRKEGILLAVRLEDVGAFGIDEEQIKGIFKDVGKGLEIDQRVEVEFSG